MTLRASRNACTTPTSTRARSTCRWGSARSRATARTRRTPTSSSTSAASSTSGRGAPPLINAQPALPSVPRHAHNSCHRPPPRVCACEQGVVRPVLQCLFLAVVTVTLARLYTSPTAAALISPTAAALSHRHCWWDGSISAYCCGGCLLLRRLLIAVPGQVQGAQSHCNEHNGRCCTVWRGRSERTDPSCFRYEPERCCGCRILVCHICWCDFRPAMLRQMRPFDTLKTDEPRVQRRVLVPVSACVVISCWKMCVYHTAGQLRFCSLFYRIRIRGWTALVSRRYYIYLCIYLSIYPEETVFGVKPRL